MKPKKYTGLHAHSTFSVGDAIGLPQEHIDFAISNGSTALALTDHGNMNGVSHQQIKAADLKKKGVTFKAIPGVESYFVDSLADWRVAYEAAKSAGELSNNKKTKKTKDKEETAEPNIGNEMAQTVSELNKTTEDADGGVVVENEEESKSPKSLNPVYIRNHLVLLPKNNAGLKSLFQIVSDSYSEGMYRYPRVDFDMLSKYSNGNIIGLSACLAGVPNRIIQEELLQIPNLGKSFVDCGPNTPHNFEAVQKKLAKYVAKFQERLGEENYFLEIQFNNLPMQHLLNVHILECAKRTGVKVVATSDSHYSNPKHWREREVYKGIAWASKTKGNFDVSKLPKAIDELKCQLYPKNADQMWESFLETSEPWSEFYPNKAAIVEAIELSDDIAQNMIGDVTIDKAVKLPTLEKIVSGSVEDIHKLLAEKSNDIDAAAMKELVRLAILGLKKRGKAEDDNYVKRLRYELEVIKELKFARYFLTYAKIMEIVSEEMIIGNARGCFLPGCQVKMADGSMLPIEAIRFGQEVVDAYGETQTVENTLTYECKEDIIKLEFDDGKIIECTKDHKFLTINRGWIEAKDLTEEDEVKEV